MKRFFFDLTPNKMYTFLVPINKKVIFDYLKMTELPALRRDFSQLQLRRFRLSVLASVGRYMP